MPEITFNFNVNIKCDPAILNFLKTLQGVKPVVEQPRTQEKQSGLYNFTEFAESLNKVTENHKEDKEKKTEPEKPVLSYRKEKSEYKEVKKKGVKEQVNIEEIKERILSFIRITGVTPLPYSSGISSKNGKILREKLYIHLRTKNTLWIKRAIEELIKEGKLIKSEDPASKNKRSFVYSLLENNTKIEEIKSNNSKALQQIKNTRKLQKITADLKEIEEYMDFMEDREQEEEDMRVRDTAIEVLSPERGKKRQIKRKCKKCGNSLLPMNTRDDSLTSKSLTIETDNPVDYWHCITCAESYFKEEEVLAA